MDAPARELGRVHRRKRHDPLLAAMLACAAYGDGFYVEAEGVTDILNIDAKDADENKIFYVDKIFNRRRGKEIDGNVIVVDADGFNTICMYRHDGEFDLDLFDLDGIYITLDEGIKCLPPTSRNLLIVGMVLQHLALDGLLTHDQADVWEWKEHKEKLGKKTKELERITPPLMKGYWETVAVFQGSSNQNTELFSISTESCRINWESEYFSQSFMPSTSHPKAHALFMVALESNKKGKRHFYQSIVSEINQHSGKGTSYVYVSPCTYYFSVLSSRAKWKLTVEAFTPHAQFSERREATKHTRVRAKHTESPALFTVTLRTDVKKPERDASISTEGEADPITKSLAVAKGIVKGLSKKKDQNQGKGKPAEKKETNTD